MRVRYTRRTLNIDTALVVQDETYLKVFRRSRAEHETKWKEEGRHGQQWFPVIESHNDENDKSDDEVVKYIDKAMERVINLLWVGEVGTKESELSVNTVNASNEVHISQEAFPIGTE